MTGVFGEFFTGGCLDFAPLGRLGAALRLWSQGSEPRFGPALRLRLASPEGSTRLRSGTLLLSSNLY